MNTFHCDLNAIKPGSTTATSLKRLVTEAGYYERKFFPDRKALWKKTRQGRGSRKVLTEFLA